MFYPSFVLTEVIEEIDLTYEGIATFLLFPFFTLLSGEEIDLTYEGIATNMLGLNIFENPTAMKKLT